MSEDILTEEDIIIRNYRTSDYKATLEILTALNELFDIVDMSDPDQDHWQIFQLNKKSGVSA